MDANAGSAICELGLAGLVEPREQRLDRSCRAGLLLVLLHEGLLQSTVYDCTGNMGQVGACASSVDAVGPCL